MGNAYWWAPSYENQYEPSRGSGGRYVVRFGLRFGRPFSTPRGEHIGSNNMLDFAQLSHFVMYTKRHVLNA